jgi:hypothetical protein
MTTDTDNSILDDRHCDASTDDLSDVLVFSICGQVGAGLSLVRRKIAQALASFGYDCFAEDVSQVVLERFYEKLSWGGGAGSRGVAIRGISSHLHASTAGEPAAGPIRQ